jgi:GTP-binding protein
MDQIKTQVAVALEQAALILLVVDARSGLTAADAEVADLLRRSGRPTLLVANKADNLSREEGAVEFYELGLGEPVPVSAINGSGVADLLDLIDGLLLPTVVPEAGPRPLRVAIIGRPNVGKSALVNALLGEERVIVSEIAGTTRDAIDTPFRYGERDLTLVDTAGIRRPGRVRESVERYSVMRAQAAVERADVAVAVFDASEGLTTQDLHIVALAIDAATGLVVCANKWDLVAKETRRNDFLAAARARLRFATWAQVVIVSALEGSGLGGLLEAIVAAGEERTRRVPTGELNAAVRRAIAKRPPPSTGRRRPNLLYVTQAAAAPPTFVFFMNDAELLTPTYRRYLENSLRRDFGFRGAGLRLLFRSRRED